MQDPLIKTSDRAIAFKAAPVSAAAQVTVNINGRMPDVAVILMTERLVQLCPELVYDLKLNRKQPLIVEIPDRHGSGRAKDSITRYVREAIGVKI